MHYFMLFCMYLAISSWLEFPERALGLLLLLYSQAEVKTSAQCSQACDRYVLVCNIQLHALLHGHQHTYEICM
ncbi:hypothetical protein GBAR_LOCUS29388 [Geodia barretti]|uniref:Secreted protein n=1 Tax=Geodia barretti TaxID=519541 RepID=A0AA35TTA5_GEOBA|nr:hypothetical protein GBAR_LOCUS29388 [Geodia barretti]